MIKVLMIIHVFVTLSLIGVVLIQRSEGGGLGIGTSQGMGAFMGGRGTANLLTRTTAILGAIFFALSLALALLNRGTSGVGRSILDEPPAQTSPAPAAVPTIPPTGAAPAAPTTPVAPGAPVTVPPAPPAGQAPTVPPPTAPAAPKSNVPTN